MKKAWESLKHRWEEDPLGTIYLGVGTTMMLYGLYRDLESRHAHAALQKRLEESSLQWYAQQLGGSK